MNCKKGITAYQLKVIAIVAMTFDHIAWMWVPVVSLPGQCMADYGTGDVLSSGRRVYSYP